jgi:hypothetical protein
MVKNEDTDAVKQANNLTIALGMLDSFWERFAENLTPEQRELLKNELALLEPKIRNSQNITETSEHVVRFFDKCSQIESLSFLSNFNESIRSAGLPSPEDEVKIKILNYCVNLKQKLQQDNPE